MSLFLKQLEHMQDQNNQALFDVAGQLYPGRIAALSDDYVIIEIEYDKKKVMVHKHVTAISFVTGTDLAN